MAPASWQQSPQNSDFAPGDILVFAGRGLIGRAIAFFSSPGLAPLFVLAIAVGWWGNFGTWRTAWLIVLAVTVSLIWGLARGWVWASHVGIVCVFRREVYPRRGMLLVESTTLCDEPCQITGKKINGVQAHRPETRIAGYAGRVWLLRPSAKHPLSHGDMWRLADAAKRWIGTPYDTAGAIRSATDLPADGDDTAIFCDALVYELLAEIQKVPPADSKQYTPASLVRLLVKSGQYARPVRIK